jgi:sigma-B regulation protein RsbU (phosphoserine phosphatase)
MSRPEGGPIVLLVDDEAPNVSTFSRVFRRDYRLRTALSGEDAVCTLEQEPVDLVITDYTMPQMSGVDLLAVVAQRWPDVGRVMISGHADLDELRRAEANGLIQALLPKPWDREMVLKVVARVLARDRRETTGPA